MENKTKKHVAVFIATTAIVLLGITVKPVFADDGDVYKLADKSVAKSYSTYHGNLTEIGKLNLLTASHPANYGYEKGGVIYRLDSVFEKFNAALSAGDINAASTMTVGASEVGSVIEFKETLKVSSVSVISATTIKVKFNKIMADVDKTGLTYTFNGVVVPASKVVYSGITATLSGLTLVSTLDGKTPSYELLVKAGTTQLSKQSILWDKSVTQNLLINNAIGIPDISVVQNVIPVLPRIIDVLYKNGSTGKEYVTWGSFSTSTIGVKTVIGKIDGSTVTASINVNVTAIEYIKDIALEYYSVLGAYLVSLQTESNVFKVSLNGTYLYYNGNNSFQISTVLTKGSTVTFSVYDAKGKLIETKKYLVQQ